MQAEQPPNSAAERLCLSDFTTLDAAGAYADALCRAIDQGLHRLQVHVPAPTRYVVRVRDVIAKLRAFAANVAYLCHCSTPNLVCIVLPQPLSGVQSATPSPAHFYLNPGPDRLSGRTKTPHPYGLPNLQYTRNQPAGQGRGPQIAKPGVFSSALRSLSVLRRLNRSDEVNRPNSRRERR